MPHFSRRTLFRASTAAAATPALAVAMPSVRHLILGPAEPNVATLQPFLDPLPTPPKANFSLHNGFYQVNMPMVNVSANLHSQLPPTQLWSYGGSVPGPTIDVRAGQPVQVTWRNQLTGTIPITAVEVPNVNAPWNAIGTSGGTPRADVAKLGPWTATHFHGGLVGANSDGWPENVSAAGDAQVTIYPNNQDAATLFYHDHAMMATRWNVHAGLAGFYLVRDKVEDALNLPAGECELPLMVTDRNFDTTTSGLLTGNFVHKVTMINDIGWMRGFTGPFTLVNGVVWPYKDVQSRWYRLRLVNAANARQYHFSLRTKEGKSVPLWLIGTDHGLLDAPEKYVDGITLGSAERADILVNFADYQGQQLELVNAETNPDPGPWPHVMQFRVAATASRDTFTLPKTLSRQPISRASAPASAPTRLVVLTPQGPKQSLLWEMKKIDGPPQTLPVDGILQVTEADGKTSTYQRTSVAFADPATFTVTSGATETWRFLHLATSGWPHPMHIHNSRFTIAKRESVDVSGLAQITEMDNEFGYGTKTPIKVTGVNAAVAGDSGRKDTVRVQPAELVTITANFGPSAGKFVYHCHMLDHEDMGMMHHFRVLPTTLQEIELRDDEGMAMEM